VAVSAEHPSHGPVTVLFGKTLETVTESTAAVTGLLVAGIPLLLLVVGAASWRLVGRALAPVEAMRAEVDSISTEELHRRMPQPESDDEIARLATTMNRMLARLEEGHARQRRFVSDASHELRSPVTAIRQHAEVALSHPDRTSTEELAEIVLEEDVRLEGLIEDLLLLARMDERTLRLRTEAVDLDDLLFEEAARLHRTTDLRIETGGVSAVRVAGDRRQLSRLLRNLTENAARHAHGSVALSVRETDGNVLLAVDDDGAGIPDPERQRIFDRFVRLEEARDRDSGGSGLGLAIVREISAAHRATVAVRGSPQGGARFEVLFPSTRG
jgi:signal transduction histidine kinase